MRYGIYSLFRDGFSYIHSYRKRTLVYHNSIRKGLTRKGNSISSNNTKKNTRKRTVTVQKYSILYQLARENILVFISLRKKNISWWRYWRHWWMTIRIYCKKGGQVGINLEIRFTLMELITLLFLLIKISRTKEFNPSCGGLHKHSSDMHKTPSLRTSLYGSHNSLTYMCTYTTRISKHDYASSHLWIHTIKQFTDSVTIWLKLNTKAF